MRRLFLVIAIFVFVLPHTVGAASYYFQSATDKTLGIGDVFDVYVLLDQGGESVNAVQGSVTYDPSRVALSYVFDTDSVITYWVEQPNDDDADGKIAFSGIAPGGFPQSLIPPGNGVPPGTICTLRFTVIAPGEASFSVSDPLALLNDGFGTAATTSVVPLTIAFTEQGTGVTPSGMQDTEPPAEFTVDLLNDPLIFDGAFSVMFSTVDNESGVDHYEVDEGDGYVIAKSPYLLEHQRGIVHLRVRAIDAFGNVREVSSWHVLWTASQRRYGILGAIALVVIIVSALVWRRLRRRSSGRR